MNTENPWKTLGTRLVYANPWLSLREDTVIRPDGSEGIYSVLELPESIGVIAIRNDDHVALVRQWRYVHGKMSLEIPTGSSEDGETIRQAAERELREETGLRAGSWVSLGSIDNSNGATTDVAHMFLARDLELGDIEVQPEERIELVWLPFEEVFKAVMNGEITESVTVASVLKAKIMLL